MSPSIVPPVFYWILLAGLVVLPIVILVDNLIRNFTDPDFGGKEIVSEYLKEQIRLRQEWDSYRRSYDRKD